MWSLERWAPPLLATLAAVSVSSAYDGPELFADLPIERGPSSRIRGVTLAPIEESRLGPVGYGSEPCVEALTEIAALGATWVSLTPFGRMDDLGDAEVLHDFEIPVTRNLELLRNTAAQARAVGLKVALIPHVYIMSGEWRGEIDPGDDEQFAKWFDQYERFLLGFATLAEEIRAELFSIGVEFKSSSDFYDGRWRGIIARVRAVYSGLLTYSANWDEVEQVPFWDDLDLIGINAFWPLASHPDAKWREMWRSAKEIARELEPLALGWGKPVVFTEFGVKSARDSALAPWEWPEHCNALVYDEEYQAQAYQAVLSALTPEPWFEGLFIWKYFSDPDDETQEARTGFSPRGKIAESVLSAWFRCDWELATLYPVTCLPTVDAVPMDSAP